MDRISLFKWKINKGKLSVVVAAVLHCSIPCVNSELFRKLYSKYIMYNVYSRMSFFGNYDLISMINIDF